MTRIKLTAFPLLVVSLLAFTSCEKNDQKKIQTDFSKSGIIMSFAQETPASPQVPSAALGNMDVFYTRETRLLTWSVSWSGLTGPVSLMHIHGSAPAGFTASPIQNIITPSGGIVTPSATLYPATGKISGSLLIDGVAIKEQDLLNGLFYMNIHTAANPSGEIRAQIVFQ